jgi:hypothetical protein
LCALITMWCCARVLCVHSHPLARTAHLNGTYYIVKQIVPALARAFSLAGVDVMAVGWSVSCRVVCLLC